MGTFPGRVCIDPEFEGKERRSDLMGRGPPEIRDRMLSCARYRCQETVPSCYNPPGSGFLYGRYWESRADRFVIRRITDLS